MNIALSGLEMGNPGLIWQPYRKPSFLNELKRQLGSTRQLRVLEAGCGRKWGVDLSGYEYHLTGVDIDARALEARVINQNDLDEAIVGDLRTIALCDGHYDLVYSAYVLEHVKGAEKVLDNLFKWTKPGGILVLEIPDGDSVFGFFAKHTPYRLHILFHRYILGRPNAGEPGYSPYPTVYEQTVSRKGIRKYCAKHAHTILAEYYSEWPSEVFGRLSIPLRLFAKTVSILSYGKLAPYHDDLHFIIKKSAVSQ
jgi:SAM-dependent methyltransferase